MENFYLNEGDKNLNLGNDIVSFIREMKEADLMEIKNEGDITITAKAVKRVALNVWIGAIIFQVKEISLVDSNEDGHFDYMFLDKNSVDLKRLTGDRISMEMGGI